MAHLTPPGHIIHGNWRGDRFHGSKDHQLVLIVEKEGFISLLGMLAPNFVLDFSRKAITKIIDEKYDKKVKNTKEAISKSNLTLAAEIWTDSHSTRSMTFNLSI